MPGMRILFRGFQEFLGKRARVGDFLFQAGRLQPLAPAGRLKNSDADRLLEGPGFILPPPVDTHIHGGWGREFVDEESFAFLEKKLSEAGLGAALPTYMNHHWYRIEEIVQRYRRYKKESGSRFFPFLRMESPFISQPMRGYQSETSIFPFVHSQRERLKRVRRE